MVYRVLLRGLAVGFAGVFAVRFAGGSAGSFAGKLSLPVSWRVLKSFGIPGKLAGFD